MCAHKLNINSTSNKDREEEEEEKRQNNRIRRSSCRFTNMPNPTAPKASSFAMTCNLLSQFIKENGRAFGDLGLGRSIDASIGMNDVRRAPTTMNLLPCVDVSETSTEGRQKAVKSMDLFPQISGFGAKENTNNREQEKKPLTIFYGGKVLVFDDFPEDKANDLMMLAGKGCANTKKDTNFVPPVSPLPLPSTALPSTPLPTVQATLPPRPTQGATSGLPIARKASLHRFLEKRKERVIAKAPYQTAKAKEANAGENQPWLGLSSEPST